jgi:soluble lytic murein transglycosylase-like protein
VLAAIVVLGEITDRLVGPARWWRPLLFAVTVVGLGLTVAGGLAAWPRIRRGLAARAALLPPVVGLVLVAVALGLAARPGVQQRAGAVRRLLGGPDEAARETVAHQVYAAYRGADLGALERMLERARVYEPTVVEAATAFGIDPELLVGIGAAESSFDPRDGADGGHGLFQIGAPPAVAVANVRRILGGDALDPRNERHNALLAAATLRHYLEQMDGDPILALLAYDVGPRNGGLRALMDQYGAHDLATLQPYLQRLPRDYPIRVLTAALAYRVRRREGRLPRYDEGENARRIQQLGIPGLS